MPPGVVNDLFHETYTTSGYENRGFSEESNYDKTLLRNNFNMRIKKKVAWEQDELVPKIVYPSSSRPCLNIEHFFLRKDVPSVTIHSLLQGTTGLKLEDATTLAAQLVLAVGALHRDGPLHGPLCPEAVHIDWKGVLRIGDLNLCQLLGRSQTVDTGSAFDILYTAPNVLRGHVHEQDSDWWTVGAIIYYLLVGKHHYDNYDIQLITKQIHKLSCKQSLEAILTRPVHYPDNMPIKAKALLRKLFNMKTEKRLSSNKKSQLEQIMDEAFFSDINWERLSLAEGVGSIQMDLRDISWHMSHIDVDHCLGGDYGLIYGQGYSVSHRKSKETAMLKPIWKAKMRSTEQGWKDVMHERLVWQKLTAHPNVLPLISFFETESTYCFVAKNVDNCCCLSTVIKSAPLPDEVVRVISGQLIVVLSYVHEKGIMLRNLSSESILVQQNGRLLLANFDQAVEKVYSRKQVAVAAFMAPEVIQKQLYGKEADWWSFGIILFEMFTGTNPVKIYCTGKKVSCDSPISTEQLLRATELIPRLLKEFHASARQLLTALLEPVPEDRLGYRKRPLNQIQRHPFYRGLRWKSLTTDL